MEGHILGALSTGAMSQPTFQQLLGPLYQKLGWFEIYMILQGLIDEGKVERIVIPNQLSRFALR